MKGGGINPASPFASFEEWSNFSCSGIAILIYEATFRLGVLRFFSQF
jgi:hypothetical protein